jgi:glycerol-3-phosphate acyltransferase PlsY
MMRAIFISAAIGYLLGSIPFGYVLVHVFLGTDVRNSGSGNIGATNVARTSPVLGIVTLLLDAAKGAAAVLLISLIFSGNRTAGFIAAFATVCGHMFPIWLRFRGGKGVATGLGSFLFLTPKAILVTIGIFLVLVAVFRRVSAASLCAAASLPFFAVGFGETPDAPSIALTACTALLIISRHHQNIRRLLAGSEPRFQIRRT